MHHETSTPPGPSGAPSSPSYTFITFLSLQVMQCHLYPKLLVLHGIFTSPGLVSINALSVQRGHVFCTHLDFLKGFFAHKMSLIFKPPFSSIFILSLPFLLSSSSLCLSALASSYPGVGVTNSTLLYCISDFSLFHQFNFLFDLKFLFLLISIFYFCIRF